MRRLARLAQDAGGLGLSIAVEASVFFLIGGGLGAAHFALLAFALKRWGGRIRPVPFAALMIVRLGVVAAAFWVMAQHGALAVVAALAGFILARFVVQRRLGTET